MILWADGFDTDAVLADLTAKYPGASILPPTSVVSKGPGRIVGQSLQSDADQLVTFERAIGSTLQELRTGFGVSSVDATQASFLVILGGVVKLYLDVVPSSTYGWTLAARNQALATIWAWPGAFSFDEFAHVELDGTISASGSVGIYVNGYRVGTVAGNFGTGFDTLGWSLFASGFVRVDDWYVEDATRLGPSAVVASLAPTGAGTSAGWTPSAGANWEAVAGNDALTVTEAPGAHDLYVFADLLQAVDVLSFYLDVDVRGDSSFDVGVSDGAAAAVVGDALPESPTTYRLARIASATNPLTGLPWALRDLNIDQFGLGDPSGAAATYILPMLKEDGSPAFIEVPASGLPILKADGTPAHINVTSEGVPMLKADGGTAILPYSVVVSDYVLPILKADGGPAAIPLVGDNIEIAKADGSPAVIPTSGGVLSILKADDTPALITLDTV